jgi:hypothetical protein
MKLSEYKKRIDSVMEKKVPRQVPRGKDKDGGDKYIGKPWRYIDGRVVKGVSELVYEVPVGLSVLDLERQVDALYAACGAIVELKDYAGAVLVRVFPEDFPGFIPYNVKMLELAKGKEILIGFDRQGEPLIHSLRVPHLMIAGQSGYGKTDLIRWLLYQLICHNTPEQVEIWIVDLKGFSFMPFKGIPHITRIVRDLPGAKLLLEQAVKTMTDRSKEVWETEDRKKAETFRTLFVLIDEAYMISPNTVTGKDNKELAKACDEAAAKISGTGREAGVGLLYCTQRPDAEVINPLVKANMDCTICFRTKTESNSMIVLDRPEASKLPHKKPGRVLYSSDELNELQVPYVGNDDEWTEILTPLKRSVHHETTREHIDPIPGDSLCINPSSSEIFYPEWEPFQESKRDPQEIGGRKANRGTPPRDRQVENMETLLDWSKIFRGR